MFIYKWSKIYNNILKGVPKQRTIMLLTFSLECLIPYNPRTINKIKYVLYKI